MAEAIRIGDPAIEVSLRRSRRARRMVLRVTRSGPGPTLTLPHGVPLAQARAFLRDQEDWLRRHIGAGRVALPVRDGAILPFGDGTLVVLSRPGGRLCLGAGARLDVPGCPDQLGPKVAAFLKEAARQAAVVAVERDAARVGRRAGKITLRDPRARWGSCTSTGDLMFSWRLIMAPTAVFDYVVAHEVAHLAEMNHSPRFWAVVRRLRPDFEGPREWLRRHGAELHAWDFTAGA